MTNWFDDPHRPARDVDFPGCGGPSRAIATMFERCGTATPAEPRGALTAAFAAAATKQRPWAAFVRDLVAGAPSLETVVGDLAAFLLPHARQARRRRGTAG